MVTPRALLLLTILPAALALPAEAQDSGPLPQVMTVDHVDLERERSRCAAAIGAGASAA